MERRAQELKCWAIRILQICVQATPLKVDNRRMHFLIEAKSLLSSPGKMIGEQYKIIGTTQAETIRHKRDLWTPSDKKRYFKAFSKDRINVSGPGQVRVEMYTKILDCMLWR